MSAGKVDMFCCCSNTADLKTNEAPTAPEEPYSEPALPFEHVQPAAWWEWTCTLGTPSLDERKQQQQGRTYVEPTGLLWLGEWKQIAKRRAEHQQYTKGDEERRVDGRGGQWEHLWSLHELWGAYLLLLQYGHVRALQGGGFRQRVRSGGGGWGGRGEEGGSGGLEVVWICSLHCLQIF